MTLPGLNPPHLILRSIAACPARDAVSRAAFSIALNHLTGVVAGGLSRLPDYSRLLACGEGREGRVIG